MTDLERRLRATLSAATEQAPPGLLDAVMRRHRRHRIHVGASTLAAIAAAALAVPPVTSALSGGFQSSGTREGTSALSPGGRVSPGGPGPLPSRVVFTKRPAHHGRRATPSPSATPSQSAAPGRLRRRPVAAAGTVLSGCGGGANLGALGRDWRNEASAKAGPLWFLNGGHSSGPVRLYVAIAVLDGLRPGSVVVAKVAPSGRPYLRFLYGRSDSLNPGTRHRMGSGEAGVTFVACRPGQEMVRSPRITDYYGGFLVKGARCVPVQVWAPGRAQPFRLHLGACPGH